MIFIEGIFPSFVLKCKCWSSPMWIKPRCESTFCHFSSRGDADFKLFVKLHSATATVLISCNAANQKMIKMMVMIEMVVMVMMMIEMVIIPMFWLWLESIEKKKKIHEHRKARKETNEDLFAQHVSLLCEQCVVFRQWLGKIFRLLDVCNSCATC